MADVPDSIGSQSDLSYTDPFGSSVVDNFSLSNLDLPGQLDSIPGGTVANGAFPGGAADPSGINSIYLDPAVNPTPTGGYMNTLSQVAASAAGAFSTFVKGSPSVATPPPRYPGTTISASASVGKTNWLLIGGVIAGGLLFLAWVAKAA